MDTEIALSMFAALSHPTRLAAFRLLVEHEPTGLTTGQLVEASGLTQSTFSTHLAVLAKAGLVGAEKQGRQQIQRADISALRALMLFLAKDCCKGRPDLCEPLLGGTRLLLMESDLVDDIVIYHNPACGTSRNTLALIRNAGIEPHIIEYLKCPPSREMLLDLIKRAGLSPRELARQKGTPFDELQLGAPDVTDDQIVDAMMEHPILINRPIVVSTLGVKLCRPSETVLDILPTRQQGAFAKEDGEQIVDTAGNRVQPA